jgi:hypothetical protein
MEMVCHETIGQDLQSELDGVLECQLQIPAPIRVAEKDDIAPVAPLRNVVGETWDDNSGDSRHCLVHEKLGDRERNAAQNIP